jgi:signal transduction histidine kinase
MLRLKPFKGLSSRIYTAFLITAVAPALVAGLVGIYYSMDALRNETLQHLNQEVSSRAQGMAHFFDQLTSELLYLANSASLRDLANAMDSPSGRTVRDERVKLEHDYSAFAKAYPYIYQLRVLDAQGMELVRVDQRDGQLIVVPQERLQDKSDRYYFHEALAREPGQVYVSPLDLNIERGEVEQPERPVIRFATPIVDRHGTKRGVLIINLHAGYLLEQMEDMAGGRGGVSYLFDRSGFFVSRSALDPSTGAQFRMQSVQLLTGTLPQGLLGRILSGGTGAEVLSDWIVAFSPIRIGKGLAERSDDAMEWAVGLMYPRQRIFESVFSLYLLYGVLALSLLATAASGFVLSRHLLRPLHLLRAETEEIAKGKFDRRVEIRGRDEIADLGTRFNDMAARLQQTYDSLEAQKGRLEDEVRARTAALERQRTHLATIIDNSADGIISMRPDGVIELANAAAVKLLASVDGPVGWRIGAFWPGWERYATQDGIAPMKSEIAEAGRTLALSIAPVFAQGRVEGHIAVVRDVSEERQLQEHRRELDRQMFQMEKMATLGEVAMGLAHEIGNPLAGMKAVAQVVLEEEMPEGQREYLLRIHAEIDRLSEFLRTFHGFAAPQEAHPVTCSLEQVLEDVLMWTRKEAKSQGVTIDFVRCQQQVPELWADPAQLKQLLLNLVINAIHAMPRGGKIEIGMCFGTVHPEDLHHEVPRVRFCVRDTGEGIAPEVLPRIFDPFFTTRSEGSGLGLAVVRKIALQHGADLHVESTLGHGTCFWLVWPIAPGAKLEMPQSNQAVAEVACLRATING